MSAITLNIRPGRYLSSLLLVLITVGTLSGQEQTMIQLKTLDSRLKPYPEVRVTLNQGEPTTVDHKGSAFVEIDAGALPPTSVKVVDQELEVESWNFSRGVLEVVIRPKSYREITAVVQDRQQKPVAGIEVVYQAGEPIKAVSNQQGIVNMLVPVHHELNDDANLFEVTGFQLLEVKFNNNQGYLTIQPIPSATAIKKLKPDTGSQPATQIENMERFLEFDLDHLDSIKSLTVFYAAIKNTDIQKLDDKLKLKVDEKFYELVSSWEDSLSNIRQDQILGKISDSSLVQNDVSLLIERALREQQTLGEMRVSFDENVELLEEKLKDGGLNLTSDQQLEILAGIKLLSEILQENEHKFFQNQARFNNLLNLLKSRLISIDELEEKLQFSEFQREEESKAFSKKLLTVIAIALALGLFGAISFILTRKFQKQSQQLAKANAEVKRVNEHLEELVSERTAQLSETNEELDTFLYKSSHDLRRPLTSIVGLSNIASLTLKGDAYELFERAADTARNMDRMLRKLINVNEINNPSQYCQIDFSSQVQKATDAFKDLIKDRNIEVSSNIQHGIEYNSYPSLIEIILQNLIENALYFSSLSKSIHRPVVKVNVIQQNGHIAINLEDNGCGIDPAVKDNIWNMFFVGHEKSTGNGLGLYITRKAVRTLQGEVACISGDEGATIFEVRLPVNGRS